MKLKYRGKIKRNGFEMAMRKQKNGTFHRIEDPLLTCIRNTMMHGFTTRTTIPRCSPAVAEMSIYLKLHNDYIDVTIKGGDTN